MLRHFQNLDFSSLLIDLNWFHVFLVDSFNGNFLTVEFMSSQLNQAELSLAQVRLKVVEVEQICISSNLPKDACPSLRVSLLFEVQ